MCLAFRSLAFSVLMFIVSITVRVHGRIYVSPLQNFQEFCLLVVTNKPEGQIHK